MVVFVVVLVVCVGKNSVFLCWFVVFVCGGGLVWVLLQRVARVMVMAAARAMVARSLIRLGCFGVVFVFVMAVGF